MAEIAITLEEKAENFLKARGYTSTVSYVSVMVEFAKTLFPPTQETRDNYKMRIVAYECRVDAETGKVNLIQHFDYGEDMGVEDVVISFADQKYAKKIFNSALRKLEEVPENTGKGV